MAWIRSQDHSTIFLVTAIWIDQNNKLRAETIPSGPDDTGWILGTFPTKEAALAELDCIERWISAGANDVYQVAKP